MTDDLGKKPPTPEELDDLGKLRRDSTRVIAFAAISLAAAVLIMFVVGGLITISANNRLNKDNINLSATNKRLVKQEEILTSAVTNTCSFFADVATLPLETSGPAKAGKVAIRLVVDARNSYSRKLCVTSLPPIPDPVKKLAQQYGISLKDKGTVTRSDIVEYVRQTHR